MADTPPPSEATPPPRPQERKSALAKRLPLLLLVGLGLYLWQVTGTPERDVAFQLAGPGWASVRAVDLQISDAEGKLLKREERFFPSGPPPELAYKVDLPEGTWDAELFVKREGSDARVRLETPLVVGEDRFIVRELQLPAAVR
ncbi:hypothetical protein [Comamonas sp. JC664]|uniref:hypothetical protein n=1 Tax=Comamonas sp. JC664 TaxID=2801917 RepID=UPI00174DCCFD|nr:hypothetical protein [Comamonas sp. JC664]MBL0694504.1 hypothetical protein [Comamonas sp. JC664]GHG95674.1 hypothetical protein GCM10012319_59380 [Comamonas sp. KCTC 72670]